MDMCDYTMILFRECLNKLGKSYNDPRLVREADGHTCAALVRRFYENTRQCTMNSKRLGPVEYERVQCSDQKCTRTRVTFMDNYVKSF